MRKELQRTVKSMPDLGFFPESVLYDEAMSDPTGYGKAHLVEIGRSRGHRRPDGEPIP
jgi:hypothetical protein